MPVKPSEVITVRHRAAITCEHRAALNGHRSLVVWFTGISSPYEEPLPPEFTFAEGRMYHRGLCSQSKAFLEQRGLLLNRSGEKHYKKSCGRR
jgi:adenylylsulfate kinase-like enzyme